MEYIIHDLIKPFVSSLSADITKNGIRKSIQNGNYKVFADTYKQNNVGGYVFNNNSARNLSYGTADDSYFTCAGEREGTFGFLEGGNYWDLRVNSPQGEYGGETFTFTDDIGFLPSASSISTSSYKFYDSSNVYLNRSLKVYPHAGHSFYASLTSGIGYIAGGVYYNTNEKYNDSDDSWTVRSVRPMAAGYGASISLTTNKFITAGGSNDNLLGHSYLYYDSTNSWHQKGMTMYCYECRGTSINSGSGVMCGGTNGSRLDINYKYSDSSETFTAKATLLYKLSELAMFTLSEQAVVVSTGYNSSLYSIDTTSKYMSCNNYWMMLIPSIIKRDDAGAFSLTPNKGIVVRGHYVYSGGETTTTQSCRYNHFMAPPYGTSDFDFFSTIFCPVDSDCPMPAGKTISVQTVNLLTQDFPTDDVFVYCGSVGLDNNPTISVSMDGGKTYKDDQANGSIISTNDLSPDPFDDKYKLKLKFNLPTEGEYWKSRTDLVVARSESGGVFLNSDQSLIAGGYNLLTYPCSALENTDRYSQCQNSWLARNGLSSAPKTDGYFITIAWDSALLCGGANGWTNSSTPRGVDSVSQKYSNSQNNWIQRANLISPVISVAAISLPYNAGIIAGGWNGTITTGATYYYYLAYDSWSAQTSMLQARYNTQGMTLNGYVGLVAGGINGSAGLYTSELFTAATAAWTSKSNFSNMVSSKNNCCAIGLTFDSGILTAGSEYGVGPSNNTLKFFNNSNYWTLRLQNPETIYEAANAGQTMYTGLIMGGSNSTSFIPKCYQYVDGDLVFLGFVAIPISKK